MNPQRRRPGIGDAVTTWLVLFPSILLVSWITEPVTRDWPLPLRLLFTTAIVVPLMTFVLMPTAAAIRAARRSRSARVEISQAS